MSYVLILKEKWGDRHINADKLSSVCLEIIRERIKDGYWYEGEDLVQAQEILNSGIGAYGWLRTRNNYEYEGIELHHLEQL